MAAGFVMLWVLATAYYGWAPAAVRAPALVATAENAYHELTEAFGNGRLALAQAPDPRLVALADPYDPSANREYRRNDLSYFSGRYYLYHSAVPVLTFFGPVRLVTGQHASLASATWFYAVMAAAALLAILWMVWTRYAPACPPGVVIGCALVLLLAQGAHVVHHAESINQVPIAAACAFAALGWWCLARATVHPERLGWFAGASIAFGFAVASRPNLIFAAGFVLAGVCVWRWRSLAGRARLQFAAYLTVPFALLVGACLLHNFVRFGDPFEFGMRYMLGEWDQRRLAALAWGNVAENAYHYLFGSGRYSLLFPFVSPTSWEALGVLVHFPFVLLVAALLTAIRALPHSARFLTAALAGFTLTSLGTLLLLPSGNPAAVVTSANARYALDFQPWWTLLATLGAVGAGHALQDRRAARRALTAVGAVLALVTIVAAVSLDFSRWPVESYRRLARWLSFPAWWTPTHHARAYGPLALELRFPVGAGGQYEPLVATGNADAGNLLFAFYESPSRIRFGFVGVGLPGPISASIPLDYAATHRLEVHLGSLNPPVAHPAVAELTSDELAALQRRLLVLLDGESVLAAPVHFHPSRPDEVQVGVAPFLRDYAAERFSGTILTSSRLPVSPARVLGQEPPRVQGRPLRLAVEFPARQAGAEPLLTSGVPQAGDVILVQYRADGAVRFGWDHWGTPSRWGDWVEIERGRRHTVEITSAALGSPPPAGPTGVQVSLNGVIVLASPSDTYPSSAFDVVIGRNTIGASSAEYAFTGSIERLDAPAAASPR